MDNKTKILILEGVPADAERIHQALEKEGIIFESKVAANEKEFTDSFGIFNPDLVLVDYELNGFNGLSALAAVKKMAPDVPVIFVSGAIGEELVAETVRRGAFDYIIKTNLEKLSPAVKRAIIDRAVQKERARTDLSLKAEFEKYRMAVEEEKEVRILMLEDMATDAELTERLLKDAGIKFTARRVDTEGDFMTALDLFDPDIILLDHELPKYSGVQALEVAKKEKPKVPCIFVSGNVGEDVVIELMRKGATDYVLKQKMDRLVPVVRRAIKETMEQHKLEQSQNLLRQSEENFRQIAENIGEIFFLLDPFKPKMLYMSPAYERIFGENPETLYMNPSVWLDLVDDEDRPKMEEALKLALQESSGMGIDKSYKIKRKDGEIRFTRGRFFNVKNNLGEPYRVAGFIEDVTEKVLDDAKIEELNKLRKEFIHVVSHQLRTPLTVIQWSLQGLKEAVQEDKGKIEPGGISDALQSAVQINDRINDMLIALAVAGGEMSSDKKANALEDLLKKTKISFDGDIQAKKLIVEYVDPVEKLPLINCDATKLTYVFRKLIHNAVLYTKEGGRITMSFKKGDNSIRFEITDTGIGIPAIDQPRIFSSFYRASNAQLQSPDGSGVSLSILKKYLEGEGGKIGFISEEGKGSTFWFEIPIVLGS